MSNDLNASIRRWREALACRESLSAEKLDELQDHLEQELSRVTQAGLDAEERVCIAARRIGRPDELERQFRCVDAAAFWSHRLRWMVFGSVVGYVLLEALKLESNLLGLLLSKIGWGVPAVVAACLAILIGGLVAVLALTRLVSRGHLESLFPTTGSADRVTRVRFLAVMVALTPCVVLGIKLLHGMVLVQMGTAAQVGQTAISVAWVGLIVPTLVPAALLALAVMLQRKPDRASTGSTSG